jgi:hypothetical protein
VTPGRLLAVPVRGPAAWVLWQVSRDALRVRIGQLERDPHVHPSVVVELRAVAADLEEAARQYRELVDRSRSVVADSAEAPAGGGGQDPWRALLGGRRKW